MIRQAENLERPDKTLALAHFALAHSESNFHTVMPRVWPSPLNIFPPHKSVTIAKMDLEEGVGVLGNLERGYPPDFSVIFKE